uniref:Uncharacterized protein n=1 Tax=Arundo donax TaxID=35708 RepID=A0A0A8YU99_ARUDO
MNVENKACGRVCTKRLNFMYGHPTRRKLVL